MGAEKVLCDTMLWSLSFSEPRPLDCEPHSCFSFFLFFFFFPYSIRLNMMARVGRKWVFFPLGQLGFDITPIV